MKNYVPLLCLLCGFIGCSKTDPLLNPSNIQEFAVLPMVLTESSGLEMTTDGIFWSHNDHNGKAELYGFGTQGELKVTLKIKNATNTDWEDLAIDEAGNLLIGDFGNNNNDRQDLKIYKIAPPPNGPANSEVEAEKIEFRFPEQTKFPPAAQDWHFDTEAMFARDAWIYLLTKDRSKPFVGKTRLYRLPNATGTYAAEFLAEFFTNKDEKKGQITSADLSPDGSMLALLSNQRLYLFTGFSGHDFFSGMLEQSDFPINRQMEGLIFQDSCSLFLTNEAKPRAPGMLYAVGICN